MESHRTGPEASSDGVRSSMSRRPSLPMRRITAVHVASSTSGNIAKHAQSLWVPPLLYVVAVHLGFDLDGRVRGGPILHGALGLGGMSQELAPPSTGQVKDL